MKEVKQINIKNRTYYYYNDSINIKNVDAEFIQKHWHLEHWVYYKENIDDGEKINSVNPLYLFIDNARG